jgi:hypothetical protein
MKGLYVISAVESGIVVHRGFGIVMWVVGVEVVAKSRNATVGEYAEYVTLMVVELRWRFAAEYGKFVVKERLDASQTEMGKAWAVVE